MSAEKVCPSLFELSHHHFDYLTRAYRRQADEQSDPAAWREANSLFSWYASGGFSVLDDLAPGSLAPDGPAPGSLAPGSLAPGDLAPEPLPPSDPGVHSLESDDPSGFVRALFGDDVPEDHRILIWQLCRSAGSGLEMKRSHWVRSPDRLPGFAENSDWYFGLSLGGPGQSFVRRQRVAAARSGGIPGLWADLDFEDPAHKAKIAHPPDRESVLGFLMDLPVRPTLMVDSGHGIHGYWLFDEPWLFGGGERDQAAELVKRWHRVLSGLLARHGWGMDNVADLARVLRLPGTWNLKDPEDPIPVQLMSQRGRRFSREELESVCDSWEAAQPADGPGNAGSGSPVRASAGPAAPAAPSSGSNGGASAGGGARGPVKDPARRGASAGANGNKQGERPPARGMASELTDGQRQSLVERYFGDYPADGRGERRCGDILGNPSRYGSGQGSFSVRCDGVWHDFATDESGGLVHLIMVRENLDYPGVRSWLEQQGFLAPRAPGRSGNGNGGNRGGNAGQGGGGDDGDEVLGAGGHPRDSHGLEAALAEIGFEFRYNIRAGRPEIRPIDDELSDWATSSWTDWAQDVAGWGDLSDFIADSLQERMAAVCIDAYGKPLLWGSRTFARAVSALCARTGFDPFEQWLAGLPLRESTDLLDRLFIDSLGAPDTRVNRMAARLLLASAVYRAWNPGAKHDWMPVLVSSWQGPGKSTLIAGLMPEGRESRWYSDSPFLNDTSQKIIEAIGSAVIVEFAEIQGSYGSQAKRFVSRGTDIYREPYARVSGYKPRRWVAVGTANDAGAGSLPDDASGNRRYVAVECPGVAATSEECTRWVRSYLEKNREDLWAEAVYVARSLTSLAWPGDLEDARDQVNEGFEDVNEGMESMVAGLVDAVVDASFVGLRLVDLMVEARYSKDLSDAAKDHRGQGKFVAVLKDYGWWRDLTGKANKRFWFPPGFGPP